MTHDEWSDALKRSVARLMILVVKGHNPTEEEITRLVAITEELRFTEELDEPR